MKCWLALGQVRSQKTITEQGARELQILHRQLRRGSWASARGRGCFGRFENSLEGFTLSFRNLVCFQNAVSRLTFKYGLSFNFLTAFCWVFKNSSCYNNCWPEVKLKWKFEGLFSMSIEHCFKSAYLLKMFLIQKGSKFMQNYKVKTKKKNPTILTILQWVYFVSTKFKMQIKTVWN